MIKNTAWHCILGWVGAASVVAGAIWFSSEGAAETTSPDARDGPDFTSVLELSIESGRVRLELETSIPDLVVFEPLFPNDFRDRLGFEPEPDDDRLARFFSDVVTIRADGGGPLIGEVTSFEVQRPGHSGTPWRRPLCAAGRAGRPVVFVALEYPLSGRPETITIRPPPAELRGPRTRLGMAVFHRGAPVSDLASLVDAAVVELDWDSPWRSVLRGGRRPNLDAPVGLVFAVGPHRTRIQVVARVHDLQPIADLGLGGVEEIPVAVQTEAARRAAAWLAGSLELTIDGRPRRPAIGRCEFLDRSLRSWGSVDPPRPLDPLVATVLAELVVDTPEAPATAALRWTVFPEAADRISAVVIDPAGSRHVDLTPTDNTLRWVRTATADLPAPDVPPPPWSAGIVVLWLCRLTAVAAGLWTVGAVARAAGGAARWISVALPLIVVAVSIVGDRVVADRTVLDRDRARAVVSALIRSAYHERDDLDQAAVLSDLGCGLDRVSAALSSVDPEPTRIGARRCDVLDVRVDAIDRDTPAVAARAAWLLTTPTVDRGELVRRTSRYVADLRVGSVDGRWRIESCEPVYVDPR